MGNRTGGVAPGDRVFLLQGHGPRGLVGSGYALSTVFEDAHFDPSRSNERSHGTAARIGDMSVTLWAAA